MPSRKVTRPAPTRKTTKKSAVRFAEPPPRASASIQEEQPQPPRRPSVDPTSRERDGGFAGTVASTTARIVQQAAFILEEEIAAGVVAAKQVEGRFLNVSKLRSGDPDEVMHRFRRDAHEVLDILMDVANAATNSLGGLAQRAVTIRGGGARKPEAAREGSTIPTLVLPIKAGASNEIAMSVENDGDSPIVEFTFHSTDFVDGRGNRLLAEQVTFSPGMMTLQPRTTERVTVAARVPLGTMPGTYSGLLQASRLEDLRAILLLQIT